MDENNRKKYQRLLKVSLEKESKELSFRVEKIVVKDIEKSSLQGV